MRQTSLAAWLTRRVGEESKPDLDSQTEKTGIEGAITHLPWEQDDDAQSPDVAALNRASHAVVDAKTPAEDDGAVNLLRRLPPLDASASIEHCSKIHLKSFRRLLSLLLPIPYPEHFFRETLEDPVIASLTRMAVWRTPDSNGWNGVTAEGNEPAQGQSQLVAAIRCRLLAHPPDDPMDKRPILYISTIATLSPFRSHGLASHLLATVAQHAVREYGASAIMAHVWEDNLDALAWYEKRGFRVVSREENYYPKLAPSKAALVIRKDLLPGELVQWPSSASVK